MINTSKILTNQYSEIQQQRNPIFLILNIRKSDITIREIRRITGKPYAVNHRLECQNYRDIYQNFCTYISENQQVQLPELT